MATRARAWEAWTATGRRDELVEVSDGHLVALGPS